jgi:tetratricopeptide (TPR) repeat protein
MNRPTAVKVWTEALVLPTYEPAPPDRNPMFLERRVYQGSSGRVFPIPFIDRIADQPTPRPWQAVWLENQYLRVLVLPELGGRVHALEDRTNGYDLIYRQPVIKPALVGLAGPWVSGGIEFNWPQHHRPATFLPVDTALERHPDGSVTLWCSDHDPMARMKGMHGVCLHPGRAVLELKVRAYNRTAFTQTFLWWANVATRVHEAYQSFFPPDVHYVADHARRSMSAFPLARGTYYGVDYGKRARQGVPGPEIPPRFIPPHCLRTTARPARLPAEAKRDPPLPRYAPNDLSFYANIPVPTSYMAMGSREDFFGGYDHRAQAGIVHVADHHVAPGKKQWTWGNHEFGYAWDRNLTDPDATGLCAPYIELMAGVYTDNQPDFSFLQPGETKCWSQYWYPIRQIGPPQHANLEAAVSLQLEPRHFRLGVCVTRPTPHARIRLERSDGSAAAEWRAHLAPDKPFVLESPQARQPWLPGQTRLRILDRKGRSLLVYEPQVRPPSKVPPPATEPPIPAALPTTDELFVTGLHLEQYRHATRCPTLYWREALRRDPSDSRHNNALGRWHLRRGEWALAETHFRRAIGRLTRRNANPADGEPYYHLGLCLRHQADLLPPSDPHRAERLDGAYDAFAKSAWNLAWAGAAYHALAELDCRRAAWEPANGHLQAALRFLPDNLRARNLAVMVARQLERATGSGRPRARREPLLEATLRLDPLDWWAKHLAGQPVTCDTQTRLDLALDFARAGFHREAIVLLEAGKRDRAGTQDPRSLGTAPLVHYYLGWLHGQLAPPDAALAPLRAAAAAPADYCFPSRLEEIAILEHAMRLNPDDARAPYYLGNLLYDRRRHPEALRLWERSAKLDPAFPTVWRNLGLAYFNLRHQPRQARTAYERAFHARPTDARVLFERDQLWKRLGEAPERRLRELEQHPDLVRQRDDLSVELCALYNQVGRPAEALAVLAKRRFQPWEGGEGGPLGQYVRAHLALGRLALQEPVVRATSLQSPVRQRLETARAHFRSALEAPPNLGEARHLLANRSDIHYWLGCAARTLGEPTAAQHHWRTAATFAGDFQAMRTCPFSELTYYSALARIQLGQRAAGRRLLERLLAYARQLERSPATIDYFATSLPTLLLFEDDLDFRQQTTARFLQAQAHFGLGRRPRARALLSAVLRRDPNHPYAADFLAATQAPRRVIGKS